MGDLCDGNLYLGPKVHKYYILASTFRGTFYSRDRERDRDRDRDRDRERERDRDREQERESERARKEEQGRIHGIRCAETALKEGK